MPSNCNDVITTSPLDTFTPIPSLYSATISPSNAANKNVTWSSSDQSVATIDSTGMVTPKGLGKTTITVKTSDGGKTAKYTVYES